MGKKRIYELAKELNVSSKVVIETAREKGFAVNNHMSTIGDNEERQVKEALKQTADKVNTTKKITVNEPKKAKISNESQRSQRNNNSKEAGPIQNKT
ncbi:translation initiation factor IF-2 N-terminal domain-containing protein, partial [Liquorilactobacillus sp.]|uniref:translation initiation factor IF-2 N-terminal domain-containing protein n=1 Tax=Liquorilactobacillus sp. TaxID=2767923 RepID=UPI0039E8561E